MTSRNGNLVLTAACYQVIDKHEQATGSKPTGVQFNKYLSLLNHELGEAAPLLGLPHCWYRWGDEVVRIHLPTSIGWDHTEPPKTTVSWQGEAPELSLADSGYSKIELLIDQLVSRYSAGERLPAMVDQVYSYAPFRFQGLYRELRNTYQDIMGAQFPVDAIQGRLVSQSLDAALAAFPANEFPGFTPEIQRFRCLMEGLIGAGTNGLSLAREASENFWFAFCYLLRLHPLANENVPSTTLDFWRSSLEDHLSHHEHAFFSIVLDACDRIPSLRKSPEFARLVAEAEERDREAEAVFSEFESDTHDLKKFLNQMRDMRIQASG